MARAFQMETGGESDALIGAVRTLQMETIEGDEPPPVAACGPRSRRWSTAAAGLVFLVGVAGLLRSRVLAMGGQRSSGLGVARHNVPEQGLLEATATEAGGSITLKAELRHLNFDALLASDSSIFSRFNDLCEKETVQWLPTAVALHKSRDNMVVSFVPGAAVLQVSVAVETTAADIGVMRQEQLDLPLWAKNVVNGLEDLLVSFGTDAQDIKEGSLEVCAPQLTGVDEPLQEAACIKGDGRRLAVAHPSQEEAGRHSKGNKTRCWSMDQRKKWHKQCMKKAWPYWHGKHWQWLKCWMTTTTATSSTTTATSTTTTSSITTSTTTSSTTTSSITSTSTTTSTETETATTTTSTTSTPNPCALEPCLNGGECARNSSDVGGFTCECLYGWSGATCSIKDQVLEWDESSQALLPNEYQAVALAEPIQWVDSCDDDAMMSMQQPYTCHVQKEWIVVKDVALGGGLVEKYFDFYGEVPLRWNSAGCKNQAFSCAGPSMMTKAVDVQMGDVAKFSYRAERGGDYYEVLIETLICTKGPACTDADYMEDTVVVFNRGDLMTNYDMVTYTFSHPGSYKFRFHLGSYDWTGGGLLGAKMFVRSFLLETAVSQVMAFMKL